MSADRSVPTARITDHEVRLLSWLAGGDTVEKASREFGIPVDTVKSQLRVLYRKLGARNKCHAVLLAYRLGILGGGA